MVGSGKVHLGSLGEAVPDRRETDKVLYMSLAMVCKNEALDVVKTVTHKRGFESWRKLCKEYGSTTGTSLHEYTNLLEYDFGTTDGFKKKLLRWENQIVDRGDYGALRVALMNYLEAEDDGHGPVPMEVGAIRARKETKARRVTAKESTARALESTTRTTSTATTTSTAKAVKKKKRKRKERHRTRTRKK